MKPLFFASIKNVLPPEEIAKMESRLLELTQKEAASKEEINQISVRRKELSDKRLKLGTAQSLIEARGLTLNEETQNILTQVQNNEIKRKIIRCKI